MFVPVSPRHRDGDRNIVLDRSLVILRTAFHSVCAWDREKGTRSRPQAVLRISGNDPARRVPVPFSVLNSLILYAIGVHGTARSRGARFMDPELGLTAVEFRMAGETIRRWGYMDRTGEAVIDFRFEHAGQFREGFALVCLGGLHGFIDHSGEVVIEPQFGDESQPFFEGLAMVQAATGKCGFLDTSGRFAIRPDFDWAHPFSEGIAVVRIRGKYGYITPDGGFLAEPRYKHADDFSQGHAVVRMDERWYFINKAGDVAFGPFGSAGDFSDGVSPVSRDGASALLRLDGTIVPVPDVHWLSQYFADGRIAFSRPGPVRISGPRGPGRRSADL